MKKRILSILLLCCMVLTLLPVTAFATGEIDEQFTLAPGGTYYFDLSAMGISGKAAASPSTAASSVPSLGRAAALTLQTALGSAHAAVMAAASPSTAARSSPRPPAARSVAAGAAASPSTAAM